MTHEAGIEAAFEAYHDQGGMDDYPEYNKRHIAAAIQAYLSASGMVLVPRNATTQMLDRMDLTYLTPDEAQESFKYILEAAPSPFKSKP